MTEAQPLVWFVTGGSRGLGREIVRAAADAGDHVFATARTPESLRDLVAAHPDTVAAAALDVTDSEQAYAAMQSTVRRFGRIDVVVNNAGRADLGSIEDTPEESFWSQHAATYGGVVNVSRAALPFFRRQRGGHFIQISSLGGRMGSPGLASYQAAKAAVTAFSLSLAAETAALGIRVTVVEPGNLRTDMVSARSMAMLPVSHDYRDTVGTLAERLASVDGKQPGDPAAAAKVIVDVSRMDDPPRRLALGSDAVAFARDVAAKLGQEDARWEALAISIDFPSGHDEA
jgi:NAD(P)-dependent dehydrogenase (short-subunit alcohol dehydrogenase family)